MTFGSTTASAKAQEDLRKRQAEEVALSPRKLRRTGAIRDGQPFSPSKGYRVSDYPVKITYEAVSPVKETAVALQQARKEIDAFKAGTALREVAYKTSGVVEQYIYAPGEPTGSRLPLSFNQLMWRAKQTVKQAQHGKQPACPTDVFTPAQMARWLDFKAYAEAQMGMTIYDVVGADKFLREYGFGFAHAADQIDVRTPADLREAAVVALKDRTSGTVSLVTKYVNLLSKFSSAGRPLKPDRCFAELKQGMA